MAHYILRRPSLLPVIDVRYKLFLYMYLTSMVLARSWINSRTNNMPSKWPIDFRSKIRQKRKKKLLVINALIKWLALRNVFNYYYYPIILRIVTVHKFIRKYEEMLRGPDNLNQIVEKLNLKSRNWNSWSAECAESTKKLKRVSRFD